MPTVAIAMYSSMVAVLTYHLHLVASAQRVTVAVVGRAAQGMGVLVAIGPLAYMVAAEGREDTVPPVGLVAVGMETTRQATLATAVAAAAPVAAEIW